MSILTAGQIQNAKLIIFKNGRLLERKLFEYFFEGGSSQGCLKALAAYQNEDGGFGNGLEPDLLCPDSSAIGAETALYVMDLLACHPPELIKGLVDWIATQQNAAGSIDHPPENMFNYPHQPWWKNPDAERILSIAGLLQKWSVDQPALFEKARRFYLSLRVPEELTFYDYPYFVYLKYCRSTEADRLRFSALVAQLPALLLKYPNHFPLFSRAWYEAGEIVDQDTLAREAAVFASALHADGEFDAPYPEFPRWRPLFLLDGLILLKKMAFVL